MEMEKRQKSPTILKCELCDYNTSKPSELLKHNSTRKHQNAANKTRMEKMEMEKRSTDEPVLYKCIHCNYAHKNKTNYETHLLTKKHLAAISGTESPVNHTCECCNKSYTTLSGLWKHKQKCKDNEKNKEEEGKAQMMDMFLTFMKQNSELQNAFVEKTNELQNTIIEQNREHSKQILELSKNQAMVINNTNTNTTNNNNQQFNIQLFLNETCKDAMNIMDFVNSLQLKIEDFEATGKLGYIEGISQIIINGLNKIDTTKRPIHCTDVKRETLYIKHEDAWEKEEPDKNKLKRAVNQVARMNLSQLPKWQKENPASEILDTKEHDQYMKYSMAALGGKCQDEEEKFVNKIMKNVMKEVTLNKDKMNN